MNGNGLNVRVLYQDVDWKYNSGTRSYQPLPQSTAEQEILDFDETEGFVQLPTNQEFKLSTGLCSLVRAAANPPAPPTMNPPAAGESTRYRTISEVLVSSACPPKQLLRPICKDKRDTTAATADGGTTTEVTCNVPVELVPAPSAIYMVMDDAQEMHGAFGQTGSATTMSLSLAAPVFKRTFVGFQFLKHQASDCTSAAPTSATPDLPFGLARAAQPLIAAKLDAWAAPAPPDDLLAESVLRAQGAFAPLKAFEQGLGEPLAVGAVMFFVNRIPVTPGTAMGDAGAGGDAGAPNPTQGPDCPTPVGGAADPLAAIQAEVNAAAAGTPSLHTYFVVLDNDQHTPPLAFFQQVTGATVLDATSQNEQVVLGNFAQKAVELGTCLYEVPSGVDSNAKLQFTDPTPMGGVDVPNPGISYNAACNATATTVDGWAFDNGRIRICGTSCTTLRALVLQATAASLQSDAGAGAADGGVHIPDIPVKATMPCETTATP
jgi:hypothetical protein